MPFSSSGTDSLGRRTAHWTNTSTRNSTSQKSTSSMTDTRPSTRHTSNCAHLSVTRTCCTKTTQPTYVTSGSSPSRGRQETNRWRVEDTAAESQDYTLTCNSAKTIIHVISVVLSATKYVLDYYMFICYVFHVHHVCTVNVC